MAILDGKSPYLYLMGVKLRDSERENEFNEWYDQHVHDLCTVPGFLSGARYQQRNVGGRYIAGYELANLNVFDEERYKEITGWGEWEKELVDWRRAVFQVIKPFPEGPEFPTS